MAKPDPALLDPARYPFHCAIATRFGDLDTNLHLNNVALVGILEDARVRFHHASGFHGITGDRTTMVASFTIEYLGQAWYPKPLDVHAAVTRVGRTSFAVQQLIKQDDRIVGFAQSVMVCVIKNQPAILPSAFTDNINHWMLRP